MLGFAGRPEQAEQQDPLIVERHNTLLTVSLTDDNRVDGSPLMSLLDAIPGM
ncbi:hypothetical protein [Streptomyces kronopolitis]|uniref:hypothetical protein n=1 Tax=Streptomyces kronopolitis TaxID=1612435 RepID=UPI0020C03FCA|nr:hypothetical protein [Streptomyces kronopolitis]MCL6302931.1 hypothetical protein [Streptomyces kronopolitis]